MALVTLFIIFFISTDLQCFITEIFPKFKLKMKYLKNVSTIIITIFVNIFTDAYGNLKKIYEDSL